MGLHHCSGKADTMVMNELGCVPIYFVNTEISMLYDFYISQTSIHLLRFFSNLEHVKSILWLWAIQK